MVMDCSLCLRVDATKNGQYPYLIHEFKHSYLMLGEHQYYEGYSVLVLKEHFREMTDMPEEMRVDFFQEMMSASTAISKAFKPKKMNMCSLGNVVAHIHWHFFPRYETDSQFSDPPWLRMKDFYSAKVTPAQAQINIGKIKHALI
jgi:diadenosine tetraphosphate (Ap4A) HIT family hydrolase